jgi:sugar O-acyltransferase (sialic acid O-acetyltransferase NeuD family)
VTVKTGRIVIVGDSAFAEIAYEYFQWDSPFDVVGFAVERKYIKRDSLFGLPVAPFESVETQWSPDLHHFFAANVYTQGNQLRRRLYEAAKAKGYTPASYISPAAFIWRNVVLGEHLFIFENNVVQPFVKLGDNIVLWSGNHIGHHSTLGSHTFVSSHVVVSGFCAVGESCFLGVNSTISNNLRVGDRCVIGAGANVIGDVPDDTTAVGLWKKQPG